MKKICIQTNIPEVDNTAPECDPPISTDCIIHAEAITYLGLPVETSVTEVIEALLLSLIDVRNRVTMIENNS